MNLTRIRDLYIAKNQFNFSKDIKEYIDYYKWVKYINDNSNILIWFEDTKEGKNILANINKVPDDFKQSTLALLNKVRCFTKFNVNKENYDISIGCSEESKKVSISFENSPTIKDLKLCLDMANYLDAYLLHNGKTIIDEKVIESLE